MPAMAQAPRQPSWDDLYETAAGLEGHFTAAQAAEAGYSSQLLAYYLRRGKILRVCRGVYRLRHFPPGETEDLVVLWLWSEQRGVFSHETALALHRLSDVLPERRHLTLPESWRGRRLRRPDGSELHFAELSKEDRTWVGSVPVTTPARTLVDCAKAAVAPDLVAQALAQGTRRGLFSPKAVCAVQEYVDSFTR